MDDVALDVVLGVMNPGDPSQSTITIVGLANNDEIELGSAGDGVVMGAGETLSGAAAAT